MFKLNKEREYTHQLMIELIEGGGGNGKTLIITPDLLRNLNYRVPPHNGDIVFVGFGRKEPLEMLTGIKTCGSVYVIESIISLVGKVKADHGIKLLNSDLVPYHPMVKQDMPIHMDGPSFDFYRKERIGNKNLINQTLVKRDDKELRDELYRTLDDSIKIDLLSYVSITQPEITLKETELGILLEGKTLKLYGPFLFDVTGISTIKADVYFEDALNQDFGDIRLCGDIDVVNRY